MPIVSALGAMSSRGFGEFNQQAQAIYIENVFSTYLYTGNGTSKTITNNIDVSGKGGLVWIKCRNQAVGNWLTDTVRGATKSLQSNSTIAEQTKTAGLTSFSSTGFSIGDDGDFNDPTGTYVSWTFRKQPKFFDVVTWTGNGANGRAISHNLMAYPDMIIIKRTDTTSNWAVAYCPASLWTGSSYTGLYLNQTSAVGGTTANGQGISAVSSTTFTINSASISPTPEFDPNVNGGTYVAYLFASNAGGFGLDGSQNVISCGSFTTDGSGNASVTLGYEPQYLLFKASSTTSDWRAIDNIRSFSQTNSSVLYPNTSGSEQQSGSSYIRPNATGFSTESTNALSASTTYIYLAIRRGPMRTPTDATKVFKPFVAGTDPKTETVGFPTDLNIARRREYAESHWFTDRLRGFSTTGTGVNSKWISPTYSGGTAAELDATGLTETNTGVLSLATNPSVTGNNVLYSFRRAPGFFDVVCYTGTGSARTVSHNLGVAPELMIFKKRSASGDAWNVANALVSPPGLMYLNANDDQVSPSSAFFNSTSPTSSVFSIGTHTSINANGATYVAYLFASCPGVSKVGSYTGTGATQTISCGFTGGARYVLIKRTDSTGDWWVWDTARGMVAGTDPRLAYNSTAAETNANWVYTTTGGFQIVTSDATVNANGGSYIYLAIA